MKKITLTADEALLKRAQARARSEQTTLTVEFQRWLEEYAAVSETPEQATDTGAIQSSVSKQAQPPREKMGDRFSRYADALKKFEKKLEEKL